MSDVGWLEFGVLVAMVAGLVGAVLPVWPGTGLVWGAALVYGIVDGFGRAGAIAFTVITVLAVVGTLAKIVLPARSGAQEGAGARAGVAAVVGAIVGAIVLPVLGLVLGAIAGVYVSEVTRLGDARRARTTTLAVLRAFGVGVVVELVVGVVMIMTWVVWVLTA